MTKKELRIVVGKNIRNQRLSRKMSINELADLMDQTSGFVGLIERGHRGATAHNLHKLASIFDLSIDSFFLNECNETDDLTESMRNKVSAYIAGFTDSELESILLVLKGFRQLK